MKPYATLEKNEREKERKTENKYNLFLNQQDSKLWP